MITNFKLYESKEYVNRDFLNAILDGDIVKIKQYIKDGIDINATDSNGETVMHYAVHNDYYRDDVFDLLMTIKDMEIFNVKLLD